MKKAKIMLAAIALVGVVGGAFAFSAKKSTKYLYTAPLGNPVCTFTTGITTTSPGHGTKVSVSFLQDGGSAVTTACTATTLTTAIAD